MANNAALFGAGAGDDDAQSMLFAGLHDAAQYHFDGAGFDQGVPLGRDGRADNRDHLHADGAIFYASPDASALYDVSDFQTDGHGGLAYSTPGGTAAVAAGAAPSAAASTSAGAVYPIGPDEAMGGGDDGLLYGRDIAMAPEATGTTRTNVPPAESGLYADIYGGGTPSALLNEPTPTGASAGGQRAYESLPPLPPAALPQPPPPSRPMQLATTLPPLHAGHPNASGAIAVQPLPAGSVPVYDPTSGTYVVYNGTVWHFAMLSQCHG